ncbi:MAG TPA: site-2 protease family protein, partial [Proteobacteria bacterium]|nr:site-2 protease family protein [Pseudomonadota bacterium]
MVNPELIQRLVVIFPAAVIAITFHEVAHGYAAEKLGDHTARLNGRLTLNPIAHIDIFGTLILPILLAVLTGGRIVFGYAKPVPVNPFNLKDPRRDMALTAAAGPATNFALAAISAILLRILGFFGQPGSTALEWILLPIIALLQFSILINAILLVFNLIPIPPLDGGRILVGIVPADWART